MTVMSHAQATFEALVRCFAEDDRVNLLSSGMFGIGPHRGLTERLVREHGDRVKSPPISESAIMAIGIGAAMAGDRPIVAVGTGSFVYEAWSQLVNEAGSARYMSGGQIAVPLVVHMQHGLRGGGAAQHSHSPQSMLWNCPGLEIVLPSTPRDARGLFRAAVRSDNPTVVIDHPLLLGIEGEVPDGDEIIPLGVADIKRRGSDVTIVATSYAVRAALEAAEALAKDGIDAEVLDPRTLVPFDKEALLSSVAKTGRLVVADEGHRSCGIAAEIAAIVAEKAFAALKAPIRRVTRPDVPAPFSPPLEDAVRPSARRIEEVVRSVVA